MKSSKMKLSNNKKQRHTLCGSKSEEMWSITRGQKGLETSTQHRSCTAEIECKHFCTQRRSKPNPPAVARPQNVMTNKQRNSGQSVYPIKMEKYNNNIEICHIQKHFLCTMPGPESSYSSLEIHISWKVESEERMEPPIQTEYFLSGGATIFTLIPC